MRHLYQQYCQIENINIVDINTDHWLDSIELEWPENKDPADRLIIAYAHKNKLPIVSSDTRIKDFYEKVLW